MVRISKARPVIVKLAVNFQLDGCFTDSHTPGGNADEHVQILIRDMPHGVTLGIVKLHSFGTVGQTESNPFAYRTVKGPRESSSPVQVESVADPFLGVIMGKAFPGAVWVMAD